MINQEEYEVLKELDDKWKWIARNGVKNKLNVYDLRPIKSAFVEWWFTNKWYGFSKIVPIDLFQFIQWDDEEPYRISDLIKEYEKNQAYENFNRQFESLYEIIESEEKEVKKGIEWLKEKVRDIARQVGDEYLYINIQTVLELIDQLDEPKVLSQELPVIPKFVADWIAKRRDVFDLYSALKILENNSSVWGLTYKWYRMNTHKFVNAYLTGEYKVEEELLYHALIKGHELIVEEGDWTLKYWNFDTFDGNVSPGNRFSNCGKFLIKMSKEDWNRLGINDSNAHFVKVGDEEDER